MGNVATPGQTRSAKSDRVARKVQKLALYSYVEQRAEQVTGDIKEMIRTSPVDQGGVIFVFGPQNSGKTTVGCLLDEKLDARRRFVRAQPKLDRPDSIDGFFYSRKSEKRSCSAISFSTKKDIQNLFDEHDIVVLDYVPFIPYEQQSFFLRELGDFVERGGWFIGLGILTNFQRSEFLLSSILKQRATKSFAMTATCQQCGRRNASHNQRLVRGRPPHLEDAEFLAPSADVSYEPRCGDCHSVAS